MIAYVALLLRSTLRRPAGRVALLSSLLLPTFFLAEARLRSPGALTDAALELPALLGALFGGTLPVANLVALGIAAERRQGRSRVLRIAGLGPAAGIAAFIALGAVLAGLGGTLAAVGAWLATLGTPGAALGLPRALGLWPGLGLSVFAPIPYAVVAGALLPRFLAFGLVNTGVVALAFWMMVGAEPQGGLAIAGLALAAALGPIAGLAEARAQR